MKQIKNLFAIIVAVLEILVAVNALSHETQPQVNVTVNGYNNVVIVNVE